MAYFSCQTINTIIIIILHEVLIEIKCFNVYHFVFKLVGQNKSSELNGTQGHHCILNEMLGYSFWNLIIDCMHK
jgi:hypothetical protein